MTERSAVFPALLKFWRGRRGMSQLDFSLHAGVSSKHISFLETGRSAPSEEMVMLLAGALGLTPRQRDELLVAAGFDAHQPDESDPLGDPEVRRIIDFMMEHHEPYPLMVLDVAYDVVLMNNAARTLVKTAMGSVPPSLNAVRTVFDPDGVRPLVEDWDTVASTLIDRLHRETLNDPLDERLRVLLADVLAYPGVRPEWKQPDFSRPATALLPFTVDAGGMRLSFVTTVTKFNAPQSAALDELQIEAWYPADDPTSDVCRMLAGR